MDVQLIFIIVGAILIIGFLSELLFRKTSIPDALILIFIGIGLKYIFNIQVANFGDAASVFTTFALIYILFQGALQIQFTTLLKSMAGTVRLTFYSFIFSACITTGIMFLSGFGFLSSLLTGLVLGGISGIVIIPLVSKMEISERSSSTLTLESAISDVLCIIGVITVVNVINTGQIIASDIFRAMLTTFSLGIILGLIVGLSWIWLLHNFKMFAKENLVTVGVVMLLYAFVESNYVGASGAIAALTFGLVIGNSHKVLQTFTNDDDTKAIFSPTALSFFKEISFLLKVIFFVYLGLLFDFSNWGLLLISLTVTVGLFLIRPLSVWLAFPTHVDKSSRITYEILIPRGLASAVLAQYAATNLPFLTISDNIVPITLGVIFASIVISSGLLFFSSKNWFNGFYRVADIEPEHPKKKK